MRGAPSPSPLHPHPSQVPPAAQVRGGANLHMGRWVRKPEEDIGWLIVGGLVDFRQTDDGGRTMVGPDTGGGQLNTSKRVERRQIGRKERGDGQDDVEQGTRMNLGGGGKEGTKPSRRET